MVAGNALSFHDPDGFVAADDRGAGAPGNAFRAPQMIEMGVTDHDPVGSVDIVGVHVGSRRTGEPVDVGIEEDDQLTDVQAEGRAAVPIQGRLGGAVVVAGHC
ncbi:hypothetical protein AB0L00_01075 [Actinoallomurus sp. NPDC052308]|uniref:hypothetical protein n=1 Tax=Actinoallomurus sp. NPDC052308 TaxID=3155530 RepID=UPI0034370DCE